MENERKMSGSGRFRKKQNTTASGPGILRYLSKESENHTAFIKQFYVRKDNKTIERKLPLVINGKDRKLKCSVCTEEKVLKLSMGNTKAIYLRRHQKCLDCWKTVMSSIFSIAKKYRGWKYHWHFENQHWFKNQGVNTLWPKKLSGAL